MNFKMKLKNSIFLNLIKTVLSTGLIIFALSACDNGGGGGGGGDDDDTTRPELVLIEVTPADTTTPSDIIRQFSATGTYTDSSTQDITDSVTWSSSDSSRSYNKQRERQQGARKQC